MLNFGWLRRNNQSFTTSSRREWQDYLEWKEKQVCTGCGKKVSERPRDENGRCTDTWMTETECMDCYKSRRVK